jgi:hypothetical protein
LALWILVLVQKGSNAKKKVFAPRNLKDCLPSLPLKRRKKKRKSKFFSHEKDKIRAN